MLRISYLSSPGSGRLRLEGKLVGPWVDELRESIARGASDVSPVEVEMAQVTFVDPAGVALLRRLIDERQVVVSCSNFVAELLRAEAG